MWRLSAVVSLPAAVTSAFRIAVPPPEGMRSIAPTMVSRSRVGPVMGPTIVLNGATMT